MDYSKYSASKIDIVVKDKIAVATFNNPEKRNATGEGLHEALEEFLHEVNYDNDVNVIVITGAGTAFCAGGDVKSMGAMASGQTFRDPGDIFRGAKFLVQRFINCEVPIIAAINGPAIGLGATIALLCDVTFMADTARIGDNHVRVGIVAGDGGAVIWPALVGPHRAKELLMSGRLINGIEAEKIGLVNHVVPVDKVMDEAMAYARELASGARFAIRWTKMAVNKHIWNNLNTAMDFSLAAEALTMQTQDHREATTAFIEKREPKFTGR